ncbi:MAG: DUF6438 domain-containing protein [Saprospiraceae bacterium]
MKLFLNLLLLLFLFSNCNNTPQKENLLTTLQGDWIGADEEALLMIDQHRMIENQPWLIKDWELFRIQGKEIVMNSIRIRKNEGIKKYRFDIRYKVDYLANDTLRLIKHGIADSTQQQVLQLQRLQPLGQYDLKKLSISSSPCHGACPIFQLEVKGNGQVKFQDDVFKEKKKNFSGKLNPNALNLIRTQVDKIDWEKLAESYEEEAAGIQYFKVEMEDQRGQKYSLMTNSTESKAVNILIFRTFKLVESLELKKTGEAFTFSTDLIIEQQNNKQN